MRFRAGWLLAGAAALTLGTACEERDRGNQGQASEQSAVNGQVSQAQQSAQQQNQQARQQVEQLRQQTQQPMAVAPAPHAVRIEVTSQVQPIAPAAPERGQSTPGSQQPTQ
ncbi:MULTISPECIES: hypothetical protein [Myxococcus]|uniref:hypothetical protein n=1 Tax=Myxococcus TaxID=32 RepID=UPI001C106E4D|nr:MULTISPECIES: hypothetical protein [Myxococcus]